MKLNERIIQNALYQFRVSHSIVVPNIHMRWGESDLLSIARSGTVFDHEIKVSVSDFKADFGISGEKIRSITKLTKHDNLQRAATFRGTLPNYFMYVVPVGMLTQHDVPKYAGLLFWHPASRYAPFGTIEVAKKPPCLHKRKVSPDVLEQIARSLMLRFWTMRQAESQNVRFVTI